MAGINFTGVSSGIDSQSIIQQLTKFNQQHIDTLKARADDATKRQTAFKQVEAKLLSLQTTASQLSSGRNGVFQSKSVASSDETLLRAAAGTGAASGTYSLRVISLARNAQVASQGFAAATSTITTGDFTIGTAAGNSATITIDGTNNTLQGLVQAINNADVGVTATVMSDGSDARTQPYRLVLSSDQAGTANAIMITNNLAADNSTDVRPNFAGTSVGPAVPAPSYAGLAAVSSAGTYTGLTNESFKFTVAVGGTMDAGNGTPGQIEIKFANSTGTYAGTLSFAEDQVDKPQDVAAGVQVKFGAGTLKAGDTFTVDAFVPTVQVAANAAVQIGSGAGAITVESSANQIKDVIPGVTLDLQGANPNKDVTVTVASNAAKIEQSISDLVDGYNQLMDFIDTQVKFDAQTGQAGQLYGNSAIIAMQNTIQRAIMSVSSMLPVDLNRVSALGIAVTKGRLQLNQAALDAMFSSQGGAGAEGLKLGFALAGTSTNGGVSFVAASDRTKEGAYQVHVTQAAEAASLTAGTPLADSTQITSGNNSLSLMLDGKATNVTLTNGFYSRAALAQHVQAQINAQPELSGRRIGVGVNASNALVLTSASVGRASEIKVTGGTAPASLGLQAGQNAQGRDVAGMFLVGGKVETAVGSGRVLVGSSTNANTADLQVYVSLTPSQVQAGSDSTMTVTRGVANRLNSVLNQFLDPVSGRLKAVDNNFQAQIDSANAEVTKESKAMSDREAELQRQFNAMEIALSRAKSQGDLISTQLQSALSSSRSNSTG